MSHPMQGILVVMNCDCRNSISMTGWGEAGGDSSHPHRWESSNCSEGSGDVAECGDGGGDSDEYSDVGGDQ